MFSRCFSHGEFKQAIGIALESYRLEKIEEAIGRANKSDVEPLLEYIMEVCMTLVQNLEFRNAVLRLLVKLYENLPETDYIAICQCFVWLNDPDSMSDILQKLIQKDQKYKLIAYQICFDTYDNASQEFLRKLIAGIPQDKESKALGVHETEKMSDMAKLRLILSGDLTIRLHLEFLYRNNKSDLLILKNIKNSLEARSSVYFSAVTYAHAFINAGTTSDKFLRDNMDWMAKASNWSKFSATAQLGVIHRGNIANSMKILSPYLPQQDGSVSSSVYSEGGALYGLGLIHANHGGEALPYLKEQLHKPDEVVQHGACLGLGIAGMATDDSSLFEAMKNVLFSDSAVAGEASGFGMGLVMLGTGSRNAVDEMLQYARETQHEKIIRGLAVGISMIMYGCEERADSLIKELLAEKDPILRYGAVFTIALAYTGTSSNKAISQLLHVAVSDASDDVRRASVTALGFVLVRDPKHVPRVVQLLAESYNPHVRYGAAMALGLSCAGSGMEEALDLLEPMTKDSTDFVRQGAYIAGAMILIQSNDKSIKARKYRKIFQKVISARHEDSMARFGAVLGAGIIDAGGRNVTINLCPNGHVRRESVIGAAMFLQFWWWFPLTHALSLAFIPTALIGLNSSLKIPNFEVISKSKPSDFAYPAPSKPPSTGKVEKVASAVLSTTAKAKARAKKADKEKNADSMDTDEKQAQPSESAEMEVEQNSEQPQDKPKKEPDFTRLENMSRIVPAQAKAVSFLQESRYAPVKKGQVSGVIMLMDSKPNEAESLVAFSTPEVSLSEKPEEEKEPEPPESFEYPEAVGN